jgi:hypothetical protein
LGGKVRVRALANRFAATAVRDEFHLLALRAGALHIGEAMAGPVTAAQADVAFFRSSKHATKLAACDTVGTTYDPFRHFYELSFPSLCGVLEPDPRSADDASFTLRTSEGGTDDSVANQLRLSRKVDT